MGTVPTTSYARRSLVRPTSWCDRSFSNPEHPHQHLSPISIAREESIANLTPRPLPTPSFSFHTLPALLAQFYDSTVPLPQPSLRPYHAYECQPILAATVTTAQPACVAKLTLFPGTRSLASGGAKSELLLVLW